MIGLAPPRPDFAAALSEFLTALIHTCAAPADDETWFDWWERPPVSEVLRAELVSLVHAVELDGDGRRFMQKREELEAEPAPVAGPLIDAPGAQTQRNNTDLFVKRGGIERICRACASVALFALQTYAPSGGSGLRASLRGGGPLTTLVLVSSEDGSPSTLWMRQTELYRSLFARVR